MSKTSQSTQNELQPIEFQIQINEIFQLESGEQLTHPKFAVQTWGKLNDSQSNVIWVCHALTGNHRIHEWWEGLFGHEKCFDPEHYFIVSVNVLSSSYGSTGPLSVNEDGTIAFRNFPIITIKDMVNGLEKVREHLKINTIHVLIGGSLGGQQVLEWAISHPSRFESIIPIATNVKHSPFGIAFNEAQRLAIEADPTFFQDKPTGGRNGLIAARAIGMLSYRNYSGYALTQSEENKEKYSDFRASSYQRYQGEKLANRFDAYSYWYLTKAMDSHNIERNRDGTASEILNQLQLPSLIIGIDSDMLFPFAEQQFIAQSLPNGQLIQLSSPFGHDGFLVEVEALSKHIQLFLSTL